MFPRMQVVQSAAEEGFDVDADVVYRCFEEDVVPFIKKHQIDSASVNALGSYLLQYARVATLSEVSVLTRYSTRH